MQISTVPLYIWITYPFLSQILDHVGMIPEVHKSQAIAYVKKCLRDTQRQNQQQPQLPGTINTLFFAHIILNALLQVNRPTAGQYRQLC
jgi:hypothetical protein